MQATSNIRNLTSARLLWRSSTMPDLDLLTLVKKALMRSCASMDALLIVLHALWRKQSRMTHQSPGLEGGLSEPRRCIARSVPSRSLHHNASAPTQTAAAPHPAQHADRWWVKPCQQHEIALQLHQLGVHRYNFFCLIQSSPWRKACLSSCNHCHLQTGPNKLPNTHCISTRPLNNCSCQGRICNTLHTGSSAQSSNLQCLTTALHRNAIF